MRSLSFIGVVLLIGAITWGTLGNAVAEEEQMMCVPMGTITLRPPESVEPQRAPVAFDHKPHFALSCNSCHHTWDGTQTIKGCMTSGCHDLDALPRKEESNAVDKDLAYRYYKYAYHEQCIGCHKKIKMEIEKKAKSLFRLDEPVPATGPIGCIECHPKE